MSDAESSGERSFLREARERRGLSLEEIAATTKISVSALDALERYDVSSLPGGIFTRAFVRSYAAEVGVDPEAALHEFVSRCPDEDPFDVFGASDSEASGLVHRSNSSVVGLRLALLGVPLVALAVFIGVRGCDERAAALTSEGNSNPAPVVVSEPRLPPASAPREALAPSADPVVQSVPLRLEIHPSGDCWVSVTADGEVVLSRLISAGERQVLEATEAITVNVGDAGAFAYTLNQEPGRLLGGSGQVVTETITIDNYRDYQAP